MICIPLQIDVTPFVNMSQIELHPWRRSVSARSLVLWFLSTLAPDPQRLLELTTRAAVFDIDPTAVRVALGRLVREELVMQPERGLYALGPAAAPLHAKARSWLNVEQSVRPWGGKWLLVLTHHLGRSDRRRLHSRERALRLTGFVEAVLGCWVRPDNVVKSNDALWSELVNLGLDNDSLLLEAVTALETDDVLFRNLWPRSRLEDGYRYWLNEIDKSMSHLPELPLTTAARESFLLGQSVLRAINSDPMLPEQLVTVELRSALVGAMRDYNTLAVKYWEQAVYQRV